MTHDRSLFKKRRKEKMKKLASLMIVAILTLGMIAFIAPKARADDPIMYANPSTHTANYGIFPSPNPKWNISIMEF